MGKSLATRLLSKSANFAEKRGTFGSFPLPIVRFHFFPFPPVLAYLVAVRPVRRLKFEAAQGRDLLS